jgi:hypothetical protein
VPLPLDELLVVENGSVAAHILDPPTTILMENPRMMAGHDSRLGTLDRKTAGWIPADDGVGISAGGGFIAFEVFEDDARHIWGGGKKAWPADQSKMRGGSLRCQSKAART